MERSELIHRALVTYLPKEFKKSRTILLASLPDHTIEPGVTNWDGFIMMPITHYIATEGIDYFDDSMDALKQMTSSFSSEGAIRYFIQKYPEKSIALMQQWIHDENVHVRRLVSEGLRPRLPWAMALPQFKKDPSPILPLLEYLKDDEELYVRRSVANNLNDISKDNPKIVTNLMNQWDLNNQNTKWVVQHALRTLLKAGNMDALALLGYGTPDVKVTPLKLSTKKLHFGNDLEFSTTITSHKKQNLMVDYVIHYMKANGTLAPKVYKLTKQKLKKDQTYEVKKKQAFKKITTRVFHPGIHAIELQINGQRFLYQEFELFI